MSVSVSPFSRRFLSALVLLTALESSACTAPAAVETESVSADEALVSGKPIYVHGSVGYSAALTSSGKLHVAFVTGSKWASNGLFVATKTATGWDTETLATGPDLHQPALALGPSDELHLAYMTGYSTQIATMRQATDGTFETTTFLPHANVRNEMSLAVDASGGEHLAYIVDHPRLELWYAYRAPNGDWEPTRVEDLDGKPTTTVELRLDASGQPCVVYASTWASASTKNAIRFAERVGNTWTTSIIATSAHSPSLALGPDGVLHVAFTASQDTMPLETLMHGTRESSGTWSTESIFTSPWHYSARLATGLTVDQDGAVHIPFADTSYVDSTLRYAYKPAGGSFGVTTLREPTFDVMFDRPLVLVTSAGIANVVYDDGDDLLHFEGTYPF